MSYEMKLEELQMQRAAVVTARLAVDAIGPFMGEAFGLVIAALQSQHSFPAGPPFARYHVLGAEFEVSAGFPVAMPIHEEGRVVPTELPAGPCVTTMHVGGYDGVKDAYDAIMAWLPGQKLVPAGDPWEQYLDGPEVAQPRTLVHLPVRSIA